LAYHNDKTVLDDNGHIAVSFGVNYDLSKF